MGVDKVSMETDCHHSAGCYVRAVGTGRRPVAVAMGTFISGVRCRLHGSHSGEDDRNAGGL